MKLHMHGLTTLSPQLYALFNLWMSPRVHALLTEQDKWQGFREHVVLAHNYNVLQKNPSMY